MPYTVERPSPVPRPVSFVVKNGSKTRSRVAASMPTPVSVTATRTCGPTPAPSLWAAKPSSRSTFAVSIVSRPPFGIASRAFTARFMSTCSSWPRSARTPARLGGDARLEGDVLSDEPSEHPLNVFHERAGVEHGRLEDLAPAEGEELLREARGAARREEDLLNLLAAGIIRAEAPCEKVAEAEDHRQDVVEVVRDASGEPSRRLPSSGTGGTAPRASCAASGR